MRVPDPKANTTTEAYLAYKAGYLEESELKPILYEPYLHFDAWLAYWAGLTSDYPHQIGKNLFDLNNGTLYWNNSASMSYSNDSNSCTMTATGTTGTQFARINLSGLDPTKNYTISGKAKKLVEGIAGTPVLRVLRYYSDDGVNWGGAYGVLDQTNPVAGQEYSFNSTFTGHAYWRFLFYNNGGSSVTVGEKSTYYELQLEQGSTATDYEPYAKTPEMLTDEEALVAYLAGVTDTYPEEIKDPYDARIVGYLKYLVSARWGRPEYPVNNEEFYLSTMKPAFIPSGDPSSSIDLDGTAEAPFLDLKMYGDTYQNSYSGKNLSTNISTYTYGLNGNASASISGSTLSIAITTGVSGAGVYFSRNSNATNHPECYTAGNVVSFTVSSNVTGKINVGFEGGEQVVFDTSPTPIRCSFLTQSTGNWVIYQSGNYSNITYEISEFQIEEGSTATDYEPYVGGVPAPNPDYPQDVNIVTGEQVVSVVGKNLYNKEGTNILSAYIDFTHQSITSIANNRIIWIKCKPSTTYTVSKLPMNNQRGIAYTTELPAVGVQTYGYRAGANGWSSLDFTTGADAEYLVVRIWSSAQDTETLETMLASVQIEEGSTATDYEPYQGANYTINLGSTELCKIGNYQDYIYKSGDDWYVHKDIGKVLLTGSENWVLMSTTTKRTAYYTIISDIRPYTNSNDTPEMLSDYFTPVSENGTWAQGLMSREKNNSTRAIFCMNPSLFTTTTDFTTWLSSNNTSLYYSLATPTDTQITNSELISQLDALMEGGSYEGETHIRVSATDPNLPGLLYVEAAKYD